MGQGKTTPRPCLTPIFWWLKETGFKWTCPDCDKVWHVRNHPSPIRGGRMFCPEWTPRTWDRSSAELMACNRR